MMCIRTLLSFIVLSLSVCHAQNGYTLTGKIKGLKENEKVVMSVVLGKFSEKNMDSSYVKNGQFVIKGIVPGGHGTYYLGFGQHKQSVQMNISNGENITITSKYNIEDINHFYLEHYMQIDGSPTYSAYLAMKAMLHTFRVSNGQIKLALRRIRDSIGFDAKLMNNLFSMRDSLQSAMYYAFFEEPEPDHLPAIPEFAYDLYNESGRAAIWTNEYERWKEKLRNSYYGKTWEQLLPLSVGRPFPPFALQTPDGQVLKFEEIVSKGKLTLIQFWAVNSFDAERYQDELKSAYAQYGKRGLNVVSIYSDTSLKKWKKEIEYKELPGYHISDLKGKEGVVEKVYHEYNTNDVKGVNNTTNFLVDERGIIVAYDPLGVELKWWLWKYFDALSQQKN